MGKKRRNKDLRARTKDALQLPHTGQATVPLKSSSHGWIKGLRQLSGHGVVPIAIGALITTTGHSQLLLRSAGVIICGLWLSADLAAWIVGLQKSRLYKGLAFCLTICLVAGGVGAIIYGSRNAALDDELNDAYSHLDIEFSMPTVYTDIRSSELKVVNNGSSDLTRFTHMCTIRELKFDNGEDLPFAKLDKQGLGANGQFFTGMQTLNAHGGGDTTACLGGMDWSHLVSPQAHVICADVTIEAGYVLTTYPRERRWKTRRYVLKGEPHWTQQPEDGTGTTCSSNPPPESSLPFGFDIEPTDSSNTSWKFVWNTKKPSPGVVKVRPIGP